MILEREQNWHMAHSLWHGPAAWNVLPSDLWNSASRTVFLSNLKTHLYNRHFNGIAGF